MPILHTYSTATCGQLCQPRHFRWIYLNEFAIRKLEFSVCCLLGFRWLRMGNVLRNGHSSLNWSERCCAVCWLELHCDIKPLPFRLQMKQNTWSRKTRPKINCRSTFAECTSDVINPFARFTLVPTNYNTFTNDNLKDISVSSTHSVAAVVATAAVPKCAHNCISCKTNSHAALAAHTHRGTNNEQTIGEMFTRYFFFLFQDTFSALEISLFRCAAHSNAYVRT